MDAGRSLASFGQELFDGLVSVVVLTGWGQGDAIL
jgi:hypothetical protein